MTYLLQKKTDLFIFIKKGSQRCFLIEWEHPWFLLHASSAWHIWTECYSVAFYRIPVARETFVFSWCSYYYFSYINID